MHRADIYALGGISYFLLIGKRPFSDLENVRLLQAEQSKGPADILQERAETPVELVNICQKMIPLGRLLGFFSGICVLRSDSQDRD